MRACPQRFSFQYVQQVAPDFVASSLRFGAALHTAFEHHFQGLLEDEVPETLGLVFRAAWKAGDKEGLPTRYSKGESEASLFELADRMMTAFLASPAACCEGSILGVEEKLAVTLHADLPDLLAVVDLIYLTGDGLHVLDLKSSRSRWNEGKVLEAKEQLGLYAFAVRPLSLALKLPIRSHFVVLTKAKKPVVQVIDLPPARDGPDGQDDRLLDSVAAVWAAMLAGNFYPSPSPRNYCTCPFQSRCPAYSGR